MKKQAIIKPIIILGIGRCGSTIVHKIMKEANPFAWFTGSLDKYPNQVWINRLRMHLADFPFVGEFLHSRDPSESYNFWELNCKGFRRPCRDLNAEDVTNFNVKNLHKAFEQTLTKTRKRLLIKITGWPRIGFLKQVFPDAKFILIHRDPRAIVNSMIKTTFWDGWGGPSNWRFGELSQVYHELWMKHHRSFIALAGIQFNMFMDAYRVSKALYQNDSFLEMKYEDICANKLDAFQDLFEFSEIAWNDKLLKKIEKYSLTDFDFKWKQDLTTVQQNILNNVCDRELNYLGYKKE